MIQHRQISAALSITLMAAGPAHASDSLPADGHTLSASGSVPTETVTVPVLEDSPRATGNPAPQPLVAALLPLALTPLSLAISPVTGSLSMLAIPGAMASGHIYAGDPNRGLVAAALGTTGSVGGGFMLLASLFGLAPSPWKELLGIAGVAGLVVPAVAIPLDAAATARRLRQNTSASPLAEEGDSRTENFSLRPWVAGLPALASLLAFSVSDPGATQIASSTALGLGYTLSGDFQRALWIGLVGGFFQSSLIGASRGQSILGADDGLKLVGSLGALALAGLTAWDAVRSDAHARTPTSGSAATPSARP